MSGPTLPFQTHAPAADGNQSLFDLVEQLTERLNRQEPIELEAVLAEHPEHADELRKIWPSLAILAELRSGDSRSAPSFPPDSGEHAGTLTGTLGDFRILQEIGRGGMGVVYEAEQISLGRHVALKVLPFAGVLDERQLQRFKNEALAAAHLNHPHIVDVYGVGCERGVHFYTMRLINGVSLQQVIAELRDTPARLATEETPAASPTLARRASEGSPAADTPHLAALSTDPARRKEYFRQIVQLGIDAAEALHHAHEQGVIHRDIKPSNLMLDGRGKLWITDFGLAQFETGATLTMSGELIGTLRYMSPEQASGQRLGLDHRCDVYSLGTTLYELLALQPAFGSENRAELLQQIAFQNSKPLRKVRPEIPVDLETIIAKSMAKSAGDRYATAKEMAEDLKRIQSDQPIRSRRVTTLGKLRRWAKRNPVVATLLCLFVTTLIAGATVSVWLAINAIAGSNDGDSVIESETELSDTTERFDGSRDFLSTTYPSGIWDGLISGSATNIIAKEVGDELHLRSANGRWEANGTGLFLYKYIAADTDFVMQVQLTGGDFPTFGGPDTVFHSAGLLARVDRTPQDNVVLFHYNLIGGPQTWTSNQGGIESEQSYVGDLAYRWFRLERTGDVFTAKGSVDGSSFTQIGTPFSRPDMAGVPLQVGIAQATFSTNIASATFDNFSLEVASVPEP
jgi:serine/threonine protein kinase